MFSRALVSYQLKSVIKAQSYYQIYANGKLTAALKPKVRFTSNCSSYLRFLAPIPSPFMVSTVRTLYRERKGAPDCLVVSEQAPASWISANSLY